MKLVIVLDKTRMVTMTVIPALKNWQNMQKCLDLTRRQESKFLNHNLRFLILTLYDLPLDRGTNNYTVSQINRYVTAVANRGTVYSLSLIDKTTDSNGKLIKDYTPEVVNQMDEISSSTWDLVHNGMESMVKSSSTFAGMDISMGGKTGTAQYSKIHADNVLFVGYAPADSPEISIAVRIANGYASTYAAEIGRDITKVYFNPESADELLQGYASSLGTAGAGD